MNKPARSGVIVYSNDIKALSQFYIDMFDMVKFRETDALITIGAHGLNIVVHVPPVDIPAENFNTVKMFLTVDSLEEARARVQLLGGTALDGEWSNPIFKICNISDPDGNHVQIREFFL